MRAPPQGFRMPHLRLLLRGERSDRTEIVRGDRHRFIIGLGAGEGASAYTWKDLRRTVSTRLADRGFREAVIGRALNHGRDTVAARHYIKHGHECRSRRDRRPTKPGSMNPLC
jgi:hypothetical protein